MTLTISFEHNGQPYYNWSVASAQDASIPAAIIAQQIKAAAKFRVQQLADRYRAEVASTSAGKLAEYRFKEEVARDPSSAAPAELAMIDREAAARGLDRNSLLAEITTKAAAYREMALLIGALEAEAAAAISGIPDDATDIESQALSVLAEVKAQADSAFLTAQANLGTA